MNLYLIVGAPTCRPKGRGEAERAKGVKHEVMTARELKVNERGLEKGLCLVDDTGSVEDELIARRAQAQKRQQEKLR